MTPVKLSNQSLEFLSKLESKQFKQLAKRVFGLQRETFPADMRHMTGWPGYYRLDNGEFRIIYFPKESVIEISCIEKRNDDQVYRVFERLQK